MTDPLVPPQFPILKPASPARDFLEAHDEFYVPSAGWHLDARLPRRRCIVSHAHSDHLGAHARALATPVTCSLLQHRLGYEDAEPGQPVGEVVPVEYGTPWREDGVTVELFPAGHVLGSALVRLTTDEGRLLYTGDFRLKPDALTVPACEPVEADTLLMECTYGLARYRFPPRERELERLADLVQAAFMAGKQPVCLCYSLGKSQEVARSLFDHGFRVSMHGAGAAITAIYERHGMPVGPVVPYAAGAIEGTVLIVPPHVRMSRMVTAIKRPEFFVVTGWSLDNSAKYRYRADHAIAISDHADFDELNDFVDRVKPREVLLAHGFVREFTEHLKSRGYDARPAKRPAQGSLF